MRLVLSSVRKVATVIRLTKGVQPDVLRENAQRWRDEDLEQDGKATERRRYAHPEIKDALRTETRGKCAYCESKIAHVAPEHVEHILPKSKRPELTFDWANLTI